MAHQVLWNKIFLEEFSNLAALSELETEIMRTRIAGWSRTKQADHFGISMSTLDRMIKQLKIKYDAVQKYSDILPPRKLSADELWQDTH